MHVFIRNGLMAVKPCSRINILEVGLGTGLNALLTAIACKEMSIMVNYLALEPYPIDQELVKNLNFGKILDNPEAQEILEKIHKAPPDVPIKINDAFEITRMEYKLETCDLPENYIDLVYFDAFSPEVQPELWNQEMFRKIYISMHDKGVLVTYCAKGKVRRELEQTGFKTERLPGSKGKREMLRASKID
jgi:tRNA U34 5-methylaminomethyl-2-thiouridine-forming methyltransferase MnmC